MVKVNNVVNIKKDKKHLENPLVFGTAQRLGKLPKSIEKGAFESNSVIWKDFLKKLKGTNSRYILF